MSNTSEPIDTNSWLSFHVSQCTIGFVGVLGNTAIIATVYRSTTLRATRCSYLMSALALGDLCFCALCIQVSLMSSFGIVEHATTRRCLLLLSPGLFGMNFASALVLAVAVDRLLVLYCPAPYEALSLRRYLALMMAPALFYAVGLLTVGATRADDEEPVAICMPPTAYEPHLARPLWLMSAVVIALAVALIYTVAYKIVLSRKQSMVTRQSEMEFRRRRLLNSLMLVGALYCTTWMSAFVAVLIVELVQPTPSLALWISAHVGVTANVNSSCNVFIYAWRSAEWRRALLRTLCCRKRHHHQTNSRKQPSSTTLDRRPWQMRGDKLTSLLEEEESPGVKQHMQRTNSMRMAMSNDCKVIRHKLSEFVGPTSKEIASIVESSL